MLFSCCRFVFFICYKILYNNLIIYRRLQYIPGIYYMFTINLLYCITFYKHRFMFYLFINYLFSRQRIFNYSDLGVFLFCFFFRGGRHFLHMPPAALGLVTPLVICRYISWLEGLNGLEKNLRVRFLSGAQTYFDLENKTYH